MLLDFIRGEVPLDVALAFLLAITIALTVHEFCHAKFADLAGDRTARLNGRVTLNPLAHFDLIGTSMLLLAGFGWGKPVPINPMAFRRPRRDTIVVSLAGVASNLLVAILCAVPLRFGLAGPYAMSLVMMVHINLVLCVFNLIPVPPLDGSHVLEMLLPLKLHRKLEYFYARNGQWMFIILIVLIFSGLVAVPVRLLFRLLTGIDFG